MEGRETDHLESMFLKWLSVYLPLQLFVLSFLKCATQIYGHYIIESENTKWVNRLKPDMLKACCPAFSL